MASVELLAIGPHPDDVELGAGGILACAAAAGRPVAILDLTRGERASRGTPEERAREAAEAAAHLGVSCRENLGLPDAGLDPWDADQVAAVVAALRRLRPRVVLGPAVPDRHPDHEAAAMLLERACFLSGVGGYAPELGPPWRPHALYGYFVHARTLPDVVVDVSAVYERKRRALRAYASQFVPGSGPDTYISRPEFLPGIEARDAYFGSLVGVPFAEGLKARLPVLLPGL